MLISFHSQSRQFTAISLFLINLLVCMHRNTQINGLVYCSDFHDTMVASFLSSRNIRWRCGGCLDFEKLLLVWNEMHHVVRFHFIVLHQSISTICRRMKRIFKFSKNNKSHHLDLNIYQNFERIFKFSHRKEICLFFKILYSSYGSRDGFFLTIFVNMVARKRKKVNFNKLLVATHLC